MWGKADETEHLPQFLESGLVPPSSLISLNGKPKIPHRICARWEAWLANRQPDPEPGKVIASPMRIGAPSLACELAGVAEGAAKSAYLQSISAGRSQAAAI